MLKLVNTMCDLDSEQLLAIYQECALDVNDFLSYLREEFFRQTDAVYAVWVEDAMYKSAMRLERWGDGLLLHSLETVPYERRKGYAYNLLIHFLDYIRTTECKVIYSHIDKKNHPSIELHKKCGFQMYSDSARYLDGTVTRNSCTMCYYL